MRTNMVPLKDVLLNKIGIKKQDSIGKVDVQSIDKSDQNKSIKRRTAVFDHHDIHPDRVKNENEKTSTSDKHSTLENDSNLNSRQIKHYHSLKLADHKAVTVCREQRHLERGKSASVKFDKLASYGEFKSDQFQVSEPTTPKMNKPGDLIEMSQVNQMRTERLANAIKALNNRDKSSSPELLSRTQSVRQSKRRPDPETQHSTSKDEKHNDHIDHDQQVIDFRSRTLSVPPKYDQVQRNLSNRCIRSEAITNSNIDSDKSIDRAVSPVGADRSISTDDQSAYQRMRTFTMDPSKGAVINRGDSFRRRSSSVTSPRRQRQIASAMNNYLDDHPGSGYSSRSHSPMPMCMLSPPEPVSPPKSPGFVRKYDIVVLGMDGVGKTSMINQFMTSEYCNPFQNDTGHKTMDRSVAVVLNGEESMLTFIECDNQKHDLSLTLSASGYLVVYSIDDAMSFENAKQVLFQLRLQTHSAEKPIILVGNKMDLERKRIVSSDEGKSAAKENACKFVEIAVALGHHMDELLVAILAQVRRDETRRLTPEASKLITKISNDHLNTDHHSKSNGTSSSSSSDSLSKQQNKHAVRLSFTSKIAKRRGLISLDGDDSNVSTTSCSNLTAVGHRIADKVFHRRRGSKSLEDLLSVKN